MPLTNDLKDFRNEEMMSGKDGKRQTGSLVGVGRTESVRADRVHRECVHFGDRGVREDRDVQVLPDVASVSG